MKTVAFLLFAVHAASVTSTPTDGIVVLQDPNNNNINGQIYVNPSGELEVTASNCVDTSNFCSGSTTGPSARAPCSKSSSSTALAKMLFKNIASGNEASIVLYSDGVLQFEIPNDGCVDAEANSYTTQEEYDAVKGIILDNQGTLAAIEYDGTNIKFHSAAVHDDLKHTCTCTNGSPATSGCASHADHHCDTCNTGYKKDSTNKLCVPDDCSLASSSGTANNAEGTIWCNGNGAASSTTGTCTCTCNVGYYGETSCTACDGTTEYADEQGLASCKTCADGHAGEPNGAHTRCDDDVCELPTLLPANAQIVSGSCSSTGKMVNTNEAQNNAADTCSIECKQYYEVDPATTTTPYTCLADSGSTTASYQGGSITCRDIDECATANGGCDDNADCTDNTGAAPTCTCSTGFYGNGATCTAHTNCNTLNREVAGTNNPTSTQDATCGHCKDGFFNSDYGEANSNSETCNPHSTPDCSGQNRATDPGHKTQDTTCGDCLNNFYENSEGNCVPVTTTTTTTTTTAPTAQEYSMVELRVFNGGPTSNGEACFRYLRVYKPDGYGGHVQIDEDEFDTGVYSASSNEGSTQWKSAKITADDTHGWCAQRFESSAPYQHTDGDQMYEWIRVPFVNAQTFDKFRLKKGGAYWGQIWSLWGCTGTRSACESSDHNDAMWKLLYDSDDAQYGGCWEGYGTGPDNEDCVYTCPNVVGGSCAETTCENTETARNGALGWTGTPLSTLCDSNGGMSNTYDCCS